MVAAALARLVAAHAASAVLVAGAALVPSTALAAEPQSINALAVSTSLGEAEVARIQEYATYWMARLEPQAYESGAVRDVKQKLMEPLRLPAVTDSFRDRYGRALRPQVRTIVQAGNAHAAVNAIIVLSKVGTSDALSELLSECDNKSPEIRLAAARGCRDLLSSGSLDETGAKRFVQAARDLEDAASKESDPLILRNQLEAMVAADRPVLPAETRREVRSSLVQALDSAADRESTLDAAYGIVVLLRNRFLELDAAGQSEFGRVMGQCLRKWLDLARQRWPEAQDDNAEKEQYGKMISLCENFLGLIDRLVRKGEAAPNTGLRVAWDAGDLQGFTQVLDSWKAILAQPPY